MGKLVVGGAGCRWDLVVVGVVVCGAGCSGTCCRLGLVVGGRTGVVVGLLRGAGCRWGAWL